MNEELDKLDENDTRKRVIKLLNTEVKDTSQIYYNYFEDFMEKLVRGKIFRTNVVQEWIKVILIVIPQTVIIGLLIKLLIK